MTQREFADKLYVTESAVSKWERGLSYPDVTLLRDICAVLDVSEHELLTASVDTERRTAERLAEKYLRLARTYRVAQYIIYGATLLGLGIGNLASQGTLSWFWIGLAAVLLAASLTLAPALVSLRQELIPLSLIHIFQHQVPGQKKNASVPSYSAGTEAIIASAVPPGLTLIAPSLRALTCAGFDNGGPLRLAYLPCGFGFALESPLGPTLPAAFPPPAAL